MDPIPFIVGAYLVGLVSLGGFSTWVLYDRKRLRQMTDSIRDDH